MSNIYEPVTEIGKAIAGALMFDDGVRLEIHDILEKWEPEYVAEKAEKFDLDERRIERLLRLNSIEKQNVTDRDLKLEAVKAHLDAVFKEKSILDQWTWSISPISFDKLMANLYKVLEGDG